VKELLNHLQKEEDQLNKKQLLKRKLLFLMNLLKKKLLRKRKGFILKMKMKMMKSRKMKKVISLEEMKNYY
jgi:hypothetical protein